jgi:PadR family transcriptional regulator AphA
MSLKHAILGFLSIGPLSGYELKKAFDNSVRHFWPAHQSQIYRTLSQLTDEGLVDKEVIERENRLDVKVYHITEPGQAELREWLQTPLPVQDSHEPYLIQLFFGSILNDTEMLENMRHQREFVQARLAAYGEMYTDWLGLYQKRDDKQAVFYALLTLEYGIAANADFLRWLDTAIKRIEAGDYSPADLSNLLSTEE